jgi:O-antigen ligase
MRTLVRTKGAVTAVSVSFIAGTLAAIVVAMVFPRLNIGPRMVYVHGNPNHLARDIVISLILLVHFLPNTRPAAKAVGTTLGVVLLFSLVLTQSRGCWVGAAICLPLLFLGPDGVRSGAGFAAMAGGAVVLLGTGLLAAHLTVSPTLLKARWTSMFRPEVIRVSRTDIWRAGLTMAVRHPVLGVGAGNFIGHLPGVVERMESFSHPGSRLAAHNSFIETFAELGILGLLLLAGFLRECFRGIRGHPHGRDKMLAWSLLLFAFVRMVFATSHYQKSIWFALVLSQIIIGTEAFHVDAGNRIDEENA